MPPAGYQALALDEGGDLDTRMIKILRDYKAGRHQQAYKRLTLAKKDEGLDPGLKLIHQLERVTEARAPLLIFELLFLLTGNEVPTRETLWRYVDTIACFDPDDALCHGAIYNSLIMLALRLSDPVTARQLCQQADAAYASCAVPYLRGFVHLHLAYIEVCDGDLAAALATITLAGSFFAAAPGASGEAAMVEITRLWIRAETEGVLPPLAILRPLKETLSTGEFWPEPFMVLAALLLRAVSAEDAPQTLQFLAEMEAVLRIRGMTQLLPAMQLLREEHRRRQAGDLTWQRDHAGLADEHLMLLLPDSQTLLTNWGTEAADMPLAFERLRVTRDLLLGQRALREGRFDVAAPLMLAALARVQSRGWGWLALRERAGIAAFVQECLARRRFVEPARQIRDALLAGPEAAPQQGPRPDALTLAEYGLLQRLTGPASNKVLAREMGVTEAAVKFHLKNIYRKLGVHSRSEALTSARARGWITAGPAAPP